MACKTEHQVPIGRFRTWVKHVDKGEWPSTARAFGVLRCNHCTDAPCVEICPTKALFKRPDGIVDFDRDRCIGCKSCMQACPYDAIYIAEDSHTAEKCNFCAHRVDAGLEPACVVVCPTHSIWAGDLDDPASDIAQLVTLNPTSVRSPEQHTGPNVFYLGADRTVLDPLAAPVGGSYLWATPDAQRAAVANDLDADPTTGARTTLTGAAPSTRPPATSSRTCIAVTSTSRSASSSSCRPSACPCHTRSGNATYLNELANAHPRWVHPEDAARNGVASRDLVRLRTEIGYFVTRVSVTGGIRPGVCALSPHMGRWRLYEGEGSRWVSGQVDLSHPDGPETWLLSRVAPFTSSGPDSERIFWEDPGAHQNLAFSVQSDPWSGMTCWLQKVTMERAHAEERDGDVYVDRRRSRAVHWEWLGLARATRGPGGQRRPEFLSSSCGP